MSKLFWFAILVAMATLLACGTETPTPEPTATSVPAPTMAPTSTPQPTSTPRPTATRAPTATTETGSGGKTGSAKVIAPLNMDSPDAFLAGISGVERDCVARRIDPQRLQTVVISPEMATPTEAVGFIQCLWDETLLRLFLTGLLSDIGSLSGETSECIRAGTSGIDLRSMMLASATGGSEEEAMMGSMATFFISTSCLNDEEFANSAPTLGVTPQDRISMQCVLQDLGGPDGLAALGEQEGAFQPLFMGAVVKCAATASLSPPATGPGTSFASTTQTPPPGTGLPPLAPLPLADPEAIALELSTVELTCLALTADLDRLLQVFASPELASPEEQTKLLNCLEDDTVTRLFLTGLIGGAGPLSAESSACIRTGMAGVDLRSVMVAGTMGDEGTAMAGSMSAFLLTVGCLNEAEWSAAAPALDMNPSDRESLQCVMTAMGGPEGMAMALQPDNAGSILALLRAAMGCGLPLEGGPASSLAPPSTSAGTSATTACDRLDEAMDLEGVTPQVQERIRSSTQGNEAECANALTQFESQSN